MKQPNSRKYKIMRIERFSLRKIGKYEILDLSWQVCIFDCKTICDPMTALLFLFLKGYLIWSKSWISRQMWHVLKNGRQRVWQTAWTDTHWQANLSVSLHIDYLSLLKHNEFGWIHFWQMRQILANWPGLFLYALAW